MLNKTPHVSSEDRVRAIAYNLWLEEGCPEGRAEAHWTKASELVAQEEAPRAAQPKRKTATARKPKAA
jgi:hypothetical protein